MYNNQDVANRIKQVAKSKKISLKQLLKDCELNVNYISQFANGKDMTTGNLYSIADHLGVSVDYLLGRTDESQVSKNIISNSNIIGASNNLSSSITINSSSLKDGETMTDELTSEMTRLFSKLTIQEKISLVQSLYEKENKR